MALYLRHSGREKTQSFESASGVKQSKVLPPMIFIVEVDSIMTTVVEKSDMNIWVDNDIHLVVTYADDIALLGMIVPDSQKKS